MSHILHALSVSWSPAVIAAVVAGIVNVTSNVIRDRNQRRREARAGLRRERMAAYGELLACSLTVATRVQALRETIVYRSGLDEGLSVLFRLRKPLDLLELHDWLGQDMKPLKDAWSRVWVVGSQEAMDAADRLVEAAGDLFSEVTPSPTVGTKIMRTIRGVRWTVAENEAYEEAVRRFAEARVAFARLMREELGHAPVQFALERAQEEKARELPAGNSVEAQVNNGSSA